VNQKVICRLLSQLGYKFQVGHPSLHLDGIHTTICNHFMPSITQEAVKKFHGPQHFDAILMDVQMPGTHSSLSLVCCKRQSCLPDDHLG
jgi:CheY-like chemotaxis protein